jgi:hypothetical protein
MDSTNSKPTKARWRISWLSWAAACISTVTYLMHSFSSHNDLQDWTADGHYQCIRVGWPLSFAEGKKDYVNLADKTRCEVLLKLVDPRILPGGAVVDLFLLGILSFSAAYGVERLKERLRLQVTISGLLGIVTLVCWEARTKWKSSLAPSDQNTLPQQIENLIGGYWGYAATFTWFLVFVACLVACDVVFRVARRQLPAGNSRPLPEVNPPPSSTSRWSWMAGIFTLVLLLSRSVTIPDFNRSQDGLVDTFNFGWPSPFLKGTMSSGVSDEIGERTALATIGNLSAVKFVSTGAALDIVAWSVLTITAFYGVEWFLRTTGWQPNVCFVCGFAMFFSIDAYDRFHNFFNGRLTGFPPPLMTEFIVAVYSRKLVQLLILAACLFGPHMIFALIGTLVSRFKWGSSYADSAKVR